MQWSTSGVLAHKSVCRLHAVGMAPVMQSVCMGLFHRACLDMGLFASLAVGTIYEEATEFHTVLCSG